MARKAKKKAKKKAAKRRKPVKAGVSMSAYARMRKSRGLPGGTHTAVRKAIRDGRLQASVSFKSDGKFHSIEPELADHEWDQNTNREKRPSSKTAEGSGPPREEAQALLYDGADKGEKDTPAPSASSKLVDRQVVIADLRAKKLEHELAVLAGDVIPASQVKEDADRAGRAVRDAILEVPDRISHALAVESTVRGCRGIVLEELRACLERLADEHGTAPE